MGHSGGGSAEFGLSQKGVGIKAFTFKGNEQIAWLQAA
jgi:hypothetical protein